MKCVAFVPIKLNNSRAPGKNIKDLGDGECILTICLKNLLQSKCFDEVYVFCSDEKVKQYIPTEVLFLKRSTSLDTQETRVNDLLKAFTQAVDSEIYAMCHCTSPFVTSTHIKECVEAVKSNEYDSALMVQEIRDFIWLNEEKPFNYNPCNVPRTQDLLPIYLENSGAYVFKKRIFKKHNSRIGVKPYLCKISGIETIDIDTPDDLMLAQYIYLSKKDRK